MNWTGKLIGGLLGLLTKRPLLIVIGVVLGHLYDLYRRRKTETPPPSPAPASGNPDAYAVLGLDPDASDEDVEQAYRRGMSESHPDRVATASQDVRDLAGKRARELNGAYEEIKRQRSADTSRRD